MRIVLKRLPLIALTVILLGCKSQTAMNDNGKNKAELYTNALKALDMQYFIIEANEYFLLDGKPPKISTDKFIAMNKNKVVIRYSPEVFPRQSNYSENGEMEALFTKEKMKKNGDILFRIKIIDNGQGWLDNLFIITLYNNTNQCFVQCKTNSGNSVFNFKGKVLMRK